MKNQRQEAIINLINNHAIETQEELATLLNEQGFNTTQATISRDIRELKLTKIACEGNKHKYIVATGDTKDNSDSYRHVLATGIVSIDHSENIIVIKTVSGMAMAVGAAIDSLTIEEIMGCIAGDDTLFLAIKHKNLAISVIEKIKAQKDAV